MTQENPRELNEESDGLAEFVRRIHEHKIAQWTIAYVAIAYGIQHAVTLTAEALEWPHAIERATMILLILGVPVMLTLAWDHGERASRSFSHAELSILSVLLLGISFLFYVFVQPMQEAAIPAAEQASVAAARRAAADPHGAISLAVLPFLNLSPDKDQNYFSDGMTEEITAALAKIPDLRVVARTSAFEFKGKNVDIRTMGEQLGATHLIEGSVRKAGDRLRITVQLIKSDDGTHIWAEDYDRELTDVFAVQEDIARTIAASLRMPLGLKPGQNLVSNRQIDPEAYQQFLQIRAQVSASGRAETRAQAAAQLEKLLMREPRFAPGWAFLARLRYTMAYPVYWTTWTRPLEDSRRQVSDLLAEAEKEAREAIRLDTQQAFAYSVLAYIQSDKHDWAAAEDQFKTALQLDPYNADVILDNAQFLFSVGRLDAALALAREAQSLEPLWPNTNQALGTGLLAKGDAVQTVALLEARPDRRSIGLSLLAQAYAATGRFDKAADVMERTSRTLYGDGGKSVEAIIAFMRSLASKTTPSKVLPHTPQWNWVLGYAGAPDRLMDEPERMLQMGIVERVHPFDASLAPIRKTERFKRFLRDAGLVEYWKAYGWPDLCHPTGSDDFVCE